MRVVLIGGIAIGAFENKSLPIYYKSMLLIIIIEVFSLYAFGTLAEKFMVQKFKEQLASSVRDIAYTISEIPDIKKHIDWPKGGHISQELVNRIMKGINVNYILAIKGKAKPVIEGTPYLSTFPEVTFLGPTLRAYVPVLRQGEQVGAIAVYLWTREVNSLISGIRKKFLFAFLLALPLGIIGAYIHSINIKSSMFGMEPHQLASLLKMRETLLETVKEGIIAVDDKGKMMFINKEARKILNMDVDRLVEGDDITSYIPNTRLAKVIKTGQPEYDQEQIISGVSVITNRMPITVEGKTYGAIASFRPIGEMQRLAEELTGARSLAEVLKIQNETLRVQKHEFLNKLHTVSGLVQIGDYEKAIKFIAKESNVQQRIIQCITSKIQDPSIAGLLLGKIGRCKELGIDFVLSPKSILSSTVPFDRNSLIVCLGNIIENSIEAVQLQEVEDKRIYLLIVETECKGIVVSVRDTGIGIPKEFIKEILKKGFTTKKGEKRGYGLFLTKSIIDSLNGNITVSSELGKGTTIILHFPGGATFEQDTSTYC